MWPKQISTGINSKIISVTYHKIKQNYYICILYDMLSYDEKYDGYQVAKKVGAEDADSRRTDQAGQITEES